MYGSVGVHGSVWECMGVYGSAWECMGVHGSVRSGGLVGVNYGETNLGERTDAHTLTLRGIIERSTCMRME